MCYVGTKCTTVYYVIVKKKITGFIPRVILFTKSNCTLPSYNVCAMLGKKCTPVYYVIATNYRLYTTLSVILLPSAYSLSNFQRINGGEKLDTIFSSVIK
jgi:hypothetical protein